MSYFRAVSMITLTALLCAGQALANNTIVTPPKGVCIFDIDGTLTEPGSLAAVKACDDLGYGLGINTGENGESGQISMNGIYNGIDERSGSLGGLHPETGVSYFSVLEALYTRYQPQIESLSVIGNGASMDPVLGKVDSDVNFQYNGGCKSNFSHLCTNWPYKHEGLESIAQFYYPDYVRSQDSYSVKGGQSDPRNECIVLFDDQGTTIENYANNIADASVESSLGKTDGEYAKLFRGVHIQQPGWTFADEAAAKATICKTVRALPEKCFPSEQIIETVCGG